MKENYTFSAIMITLLLGCVLWIYAIFNFLDTGGYAFLLCVSCLTGVITGIATIVGIVYAIILHQRSCEMLQEIRQLKNNESTSSEKK